MGGCYVAQFGTCDSSSFSSLFTTSCLACRWLNCPRPTCLWPLYFNFLCHLETSSCSLILETLWLAYSGPSIRCQQFILETVPPASGAGPTTSGLEAGRAKVVESSCSLLMFPSRDRSRVRQKRHSLAVSRLFLLALPLPASPGALLLVLEWTLRVHEMMLKWVALL